MINIELCDLIKLHCSCPIISLFVYFMFSDKSRHIDMIDMKFILISASFRGGVSPVYRNLGGDRRILFNKFIKGFALLPQTSLKKVTITYFKISWALEKPKWSGLPWSTCTLVWFSMIWDESLFEVVPKFYDTTIVQDISTSFCFDEIANEKVFRKSIIIDVNAKSENS